MISERSYSRQYTHEEALLDIKEKSGTWYDPEIVGAFEKIINPDLP
jgi:HD-GYP domain-containing protein (c-di-GMP phosphodiesterase class II)